MNKKAILFLAVAGWSCLSEASPVQGQVPEEQFVFASTKASIRIPVPPGFVPDVVTDAPQALPSRLVRIAQELEADAGSKVSVQICREQKFIIEHARAPRTSLAWWLQLDGDPALIERYRRALEARWAEPAAMIRLEVILLRGAEGAPPDKVAVVSRAGMTQWRGRQQAASIVSAPMIQVFLGQPAEFSMLRRFDYRRRVDPSSFEPGQDLKYFQEVVQEGTEIRLFVDEPILRDGLVLEARIVGRGIVRPVPTVTLKLHDGRDLKLDAPEVDERTWSSGPVLLTHDDDAIIARLDLPKESGAFEPMVFVCRVVKVPTRGEGLVGELRRLQVAPRDGEELQSLAEFVLVRWSGTPHPAGTRVRYRREGADEVVLFALETRSSDQLFIVQEGAPNDGDLVPAYIPPR